tara:strand:+ start:2412 stop:2813 length:402 start_codon:yes stop_codon:yes gene_type:complete
MSEYDDSYGDNMYSEDNYEEFESENGGKMEVNVYILANLVKGVVEDQVGVVAKILDSDIRMLTCADSTGRTLMMYAAYARANRVLRLILDNNIIPPDVEDFNELTAFDWAVLGNNSRGARMIQRWIKNNQPLD